MIRPWQILTVYLVSVAVAFAAMFAVTRNALQLDRDEQLARLRAELEERVGGALWTMDAEMSPLLASELSRPVSDFQLALQQKLPIKGKLPPLAGIPAPSGKPTKEQPALMRAESDDIKPPRVGVETGEAMVRLRFLVNIDNGWQSPQCPPPIAAGKRNVASSSSPAAAILGDIRSAVDFNQLASTLPLPPDIRARLALGEMGNAAQSGPWAANSYSQQQLEVNSELQQRVAQQQAAVYNPPNQAPAQQAIPETIGANPGEPQRAQFRNDLARRNLMNQRKEAVNSILNAKRPVEERWTNILWIGDHLVLARLATINGSASILGSCLDGEQIKVRLRERVRDALPEFEFARITGDEQVLKHRALATLPLRVNPPPITLASVEGWTPIQMTLGLAWLFLSLATLSVGALLIGAIRLSERRASFVSAVTHELRSPLTTFQLYTEMLLGGMVAPTDRETYLKTLKAESERLAHLVENVLQYSRLERGKRPKSDQTLPIVELMHRMAPRLEERLKQAGMELQVQYLELAKTASVTTDPSAVEQILFNLADNASKYACDGSPKQLDVNWLVEGDRAICLVRDYGPGISKRGRQTLFLPFSKSVDEAAESAPGVGLGLALCRRLASQLGGSLSLVQPSTDPSGAVFRLDAGAIGKS